jgi:hypothetical protein
MNYMVALYRLGGVYRRRIVLDSSGQLVRAAVEDDFHHFEIELSMADEVVSAIDVRSFRHTWTTCPGAVAALDDFIGQRIESRILRRKDVTDPSQHCTHLYDLAILAICRGSRGVGRTVYDIEIEDRFQIRNNEKAPLDPPDHRNYPALGRSEAYLRRDGVLALHWSLDGHVITAPSEVAGIDYRKIGKWAEKLDDDSVLEAIKVLRQGVFVSEGRLFDLDGMDGPSQTRLPEGVCYALQRENIRDGYRPSGMQIDFTNKPERLLADWPHPPKPG